MAARSYSEFPERRLGKPGKPPLTGRRGSRATLPKESTAKWPTSKGNAKADRGLGYPLIKTFVAGEYMKGNPGHMMPGHAKAMPSKSKAMVSKMMHEVFTNEPSTVTRANVSGARKRKMMQAMAFNKARKAGAKVPYK